MEDTKTVNPIARREALKIIGQSLVAGTAAAVVLGRSDAASAADAKLDCAKDAKLDKASQQMRKALQYVEESKQAGKVCSKCMQWVAPAKAGTCGGCKLFTGPVNPNGFCLSFAPTKA